MFELDPNHPFDFGDPAAQRVFAITAMISALIIGLIFLVSATDANAGTATENTVAIMNAMGFTACFVSTVAVIGICVIVAIVQRTMRHDKMIAHQENLEKMRLSNTKEITVPRT